MVQKKEGVEKTSEFVKWFSKIDKNSKSLVGEKGANLGELFSNKFPVPNGFVVTSDAYINFLTSSKLYDKIKGIVNGLDFKNDSLVEENSKKIKSLIMSSELPEELKEEIIDSYSVLGANKLDIERGSARDILNNAFEPAFVSVRSSVPFKSSKEKVREQDTYLNVKGNEEVLEHVKSTFASLFNPLTIKKVLKKISFDKFKIAVIIEKMVESEKSCSSISKDSSGNINISAIWGFGEGFNLKDVSPDRYVLSSELELLDKKVGEKNSYVVRDSSGSLKALKSGEERKNSQVLSNYEIQRIGDLSQKIESHFQSPQKIDFVINDSEIYVLETKEFKGFSSEAPKKEMKKEEVLEEIKKPSKVEKVEKVTKTKLKLILDSPYLLEESLKTALKSVGILKIEKIIERSGKHPKYFLDSNYINQYENLVYEGVKGVYESFDEVWVRTSDFLTSDFSNLEGAPNEKEENPLLGLHGIRYGLKNLEILEAELRALKRVSGRTFIGVIIPNVTSLEEVKKVKSLLKKLDFPGAKVGVMIETPASMQLVKEFCNEGVDSFAINIDSFAQNLLSIDLSNQEVKGILDYMHPSIVYQLEYLLRVARRNNVETSIFGRGVYGDNLLSYVVSKGVNFVLVSPEHAKEISEKVFSFENDFLKMSDTDPRKYEMEKEKKEYLKEKHEMGPTDKKPKNENKERSVDVLGIF